MNGLSVEPDTDGESGWPTSDEHMPCPLGVLGVCVTGVVVGVEMPQVLKFRQSLAFTPMGMVGKALTKATDTACTALRGLQGRPVGEGVESRPESHSPEPNPEWNLESQCTHSWRHRDRHALLHGSANRRVCDEVTQPCDPIYKLKRSPGVSIGHACRSFKRLSMSAERVV